MLTWNVSSRARTGWHEEKRQEILSMLQGKPLVCPRAHLGVPPKITNN